ncbi:MAG: Rpn family recombination-promoting nuclease/putative transposase [Planctomycetaceae bacterium]|nr:Rpn family recombination-promoting nuclease/putative transposase [Planctomycetaceae bacterium]
MARKKSAAPLRLLPLKNDFVFKLVFGDKRRVDLLTAFLQAVLDLPAEEYEKVTIVDPNVKKEYNKDKAGVLDVKIHTKSGNVVDVEIQVEPDAPLEKRILFYQAKMLTEQIGEGNDYDIIKPVISIIITDFQLIANSKAYHHRFRFYDAKNKVELTNVQEINTLELTKLPKKSDETDLFDWMMLIRAKSEEEYDMLAEKKPIFKKVVAVVKKLSADEEARMVYDKQELWRMDYAATMRNAARKGMARGLEAGRAEGRAEGKAEGRAEGETKAKIETARIMKSKGFSPADIADVTGLTEKEIERI